MPRAQCVLTYNRQECLLLPTTTPSPRNSNALLEMEDNWYLRQENILPLETAWNEGRFYGLLLKGNQPFTRFQRLGIFLTGLQLLEFGSLPFIIGQGLHPRLGRL